MKNLLNQKKELEEIICRLILTKKPFNAHLAELFDIINEINKERS